MNLLINNYYLIFLILFKIKYLLLIINYLILPLYTLIIYNNQDFCQFKNSIK